MSTESTHDAAEFLMPRSRLDDAEQTINEAKLMRAVLAGLLLELGDDAWVPYQRLGEAAFVEVVFERHPPGTGVTLSLRRRT